MREEPERTQPVGNICTIYIRPDPTTEPPTSRTPLRKNTCSSCTSGISLSDKFCTRCGAPNENYEDVKDIRSCDFYGNPWN